MLRIDRRRLFGFHPIFLHSVDVTQPSHLEVGEGHAPRLFSSILLYFAVRGLTPNARFTERSHPLATVWRASPKT